MVYIGYLLAFLGLYLLFDGLIFLGAMFLFFGGLMSEGFTIGLSAISILSLISSFAYGIHNEFTTTIIILCLVSAVLAAASRGRGHWESDLGLFDIGGSSGSGWGDGGGSSGGGGD